MNKLIKKSVLTLLASAVLFSCKKDDENTTPSGSVSNPNYVLSLRVQSSEQTTADYLITANSLTSGEISSNSQGIELVGWNYTFGSGGSYFSFNGSELECTVHELSNGIIKESDKFAIESADVIAEYDSDNILAIAAPWGGGSYDCQLMVINKETATISKTVDHPLYVSYDGTTQLNAWPTGAYRDGNKLFVSFYPLNGTTWETPNTDTAYVSVFSYPDLAYIETIKDARTSPIGYYADQPCLLTAENGDLYTISTGGAYPAGFTTSNKPSGILKIKDGESVFDQTYFYDIETTEGYQVYSAVYAGNGLAVARVASAAANIEAYHWGAFSATTPALNIAVIDLVNEDFTLVSDVPTHGGQYKTPYLAQNGKVYISVNTGTEANIYEVNPSTATAKKGAKIIGNELQGIYATK